jgi:D-alanyl-D-alanine carboxypeptidase (penicillin-binding protein 5/6)
MNELLYGILMRSSNDGCVAAAEHVAGSTARFAEWMNEKARALGATDTHFVTVNGLYDPKHYSSARDLAIFARYAMQYPLFNQIVATQEHTLQRTINWKDTLVRNHNKFLARYEGADGVKTGYVRQSGKCLVASATRPEAGSPWRLLTVVLNSPDIYGDSARMMDWGRKYYAPVVVSRRGESLGTVQVRDGARPDVSVNAKDDLIVILPRQMGKNIEREIHTPKTLQAPVSMGHAAGTVTAVVDGIPQGQVEIIASTPVAPRVWMASVASPWTGGGMILAAFILGSRYARAFAKSSRRRRRRLAARRREPDHQRESYS